MSKIGTLDRNIISLEVLHDGSVINTGGTGGNGTPLNVVYQNTSQGYQYQEGVYGATSTTTFASSAGAVVGIHFRFYPTANTKTLFQLASGATINLSSSNTITGTNVTISNVYVNNQASNSITLNAYNDVVVTFTSLTASAFVIGQSSFLGYMGVVRLLNTYPSLNAIQKFYMEGKKLLAGKSYNDLMSGLVAYYDFRGDANDIVGENNGTVTGATLTTDRFGNANSGYSFNGTSAQISGPYIVNTSSDFTVNFSIKTGSSLTGNRTLYWRMGASIPYLVMYLNWGKPQILINPTNLSSISTLSVNTYYNLTYTKVGNLHSIYINGVLDNSNSWTYTNQSLSVGQSIGQNENTNWWNGNIDFVQFFNKGLSATEVLSLYTQSQKEYLYPYYPNIPKQLQNGLQFWYAGNTSGTTAYDVSGNGNNGVLVNTPVVTRRMLAKQTAFNGSNQRIVTNSNIGLSGSAARSYSFTINASSLAGTYYVLDTGAAVATNRFLIYVNSAGKVGVNTWEAQDMLTTNTVLSVNKNYNVVVTYAGGASLNSTSTKVYIDEVAVPTNNPSTSTLNTTNAVQYIGCSLALANFFPGKITNLQIFNRELSATEIQMLRYSLYLK